MAEPTAVNSQVTGAAEPLGVNPQITDAVTQTNVKVLGEAPAMALGSLYQTIGNSVAMAAANAVYAQQQANITHQAATTMGVAKLLSISATSLGETKPEGSD